MYLIDEHPRDRLKRCDSRALSDHELLALCLNARESMPAALNISREILEDDLGGLTRLDATLFKRLTTSSAAALLAVVEVARRLARLRMTRVLLDRRDLVADYLTLRYQGSQEIVGALFLDSQGRLLAERELFRGTSNRAAVEPQVVVRHALLCNACSYILFHNHPGGNPAPSAEDLLFTRRLVEAGKFVGVPLVDHIILGEQGRWVSLQQRRGLW